MLITEIFKKKNSGNLIVAKLQFMAYNIFEHTCIRQVEVNVYY